MFNISVYIHKNQSFQTKIIMLHKISAQIIMLIFIYEGV
ncbi:hypothetical protein A0R60_3955 [Enterobacter asburiae]|nr:hypothetical protein A0R60_3955 [Enterobacter asburiae]